MRRVFVKGMIILLAAALLLSAFCLSACSGTESGGKVEEPEEKAVDAAREISFTTEPGVRVLLKEGETEDDFKRTSDGRVVLKPGMYYKVKDRTVEWSLAAVVNGSVILVIEYADPDDVFLTYILTPLNTEDNEVSYISGDDNVQIDRFGHVLFLEYDEKPVVVALRTKEGTYASAVLLWDKPHEEIPMS